MKRTRRFERGIYLLPTLFTVGNLFCGYSSLVQSSRDRIEMAALLIIIAGVLDGLDGRIARLTNTTSDFGVQFDSLADVVSFGVAPAMLAYHWALSSFGRLGWLIGFIYVVCAGMRLARFNLQSSPDDRRHFAGLPSPAAAGTLACVAYAFPARPPEGWLSVALTLMVACLGLLMISRFRYRSFKEFDLGNRRPFTYVLPLTVIIVAIAIRPKWALLSFSTTYVVSGPALYLFSLARRPAHGFTPVAPKEDGIWDERS